MTTATTVHPVHDGQVASDVPLRGTGNSGQLIAAELVARGMSVRLAGRRRGPLEDLARTLAAVRGKSDVRAVDAGDALLLTRRDRGRRGGPVRYRAVHRGWPAR